MILIESDPPNKELGPKYLHEIGHGYISLIYLNDLKKAGDGDGQYQRGLVK